MKGAQSGLPTKTKNLILRNPIMKGLIERDPIVRGLIVKGHIEKGIVGIDLTMENLTTIITMAVV
jgi:hypothetical protein